SNLAGKTPTAIIESPKWYLKRVSRQVPVRTEKAASTLPEIGDDNDIGLVISRPGFDPCLPFAHVVGCSEICVPITAPDLESTELVDQKEVGHAGDRVGAIHRRRAILQDVDVINHWKRNQVNVHAAAESDAVQRTKGDTFAVNQYEGFFGQQAAQIELDRTITAIADVLVDGAACFLRQKSCQVRCIADAQLFDVCWTIRIHRIRADFFRGRNVRARHDNLLNRYPRLASPRPERSLLRLGLNNRTKSHCDHRETEAAVAASLCRGALALLPMAARQHPPSPRFGVAGSAVATTLRIYETASNKLGGLAALVRRRVHRRHACHYRQLRALVAVVGNRALHLGRSNSGTNGSSTVPVDLLANPVTGRRNRCRLRIHRIVVYQVEVVCSWDARKSLPETSESGPSSHGQS